MNIKQRKSLSQVFLKESWPVEQLATWVGERGASDVLEIGPGGGILTRELLSRNLVVTAVERDDRFAKALEGTHDNLTVVNQDFLKFPLGDWQEGKSNNAIVGNVPYHISTPILECIFPVLAKSRGAAIMVQLEFAERMAAASGNKQFGSLSVFCQTQAKVRLLYEVPKECFKPVPKVDSAVVEVLPLAETLAPDVLQTTHKLARLAFQQRRKKTSNGLKPYRDQLEKFDLDRRPEQIPVEEFVAMAKEVLSNPPPQP